MNAMIESNNGSGNGSKPQFTAAMRLVIITPDVAGYLLSRNKDNRRINHKYARKLASQMSEWAVNGETIKCNGRWGEGDRIICDRLVDGQHRLTACVESNVPFMTYVVLGNDLDFATIDTGKRRTAGDVLGMSGHINGNRLAAALRMVHSYRLGMDNGIVEASNHEVLALIDVYPGVAESMAFVRGTRGQVKLVEPSVIDACHWLFSQASRDDADAFVTALLTGIDLDKESPIYAIRERFLKERTGKSKINKVYAMALVIKAWNAYRDGVAPRKRALRLRQNGPGAEPYPVIK